MISDLADYAGLLLAARVVVWLGLSACVQAQMALRAYVANYVGHCFQEFRRNPKRWFRCSLKALAHACGSDQFDRLGIGVGSPRLPVGGFAVKASGLTDPLE